MDLFIVTQRDPFFIDSFLSSIDYSLFDNVFIYDTPNFGSSKFKGLTKFYNLFGFKDTVYSIFKFITIKPDLQRVNITIKNCSFGEVMKNIVEKNIPEDAILLSVSAPHLIPADVLDKFNTKLNFHSGRLPDYAGMMPMFWQMSDGRSHFTITLHEMGNDIDTGDILFEYDVPFCRTLLASMIESKKIGAHVFNLYINNKLISSKLQQLSSPKYNKYPTIQEIKQAKSQKGYPYE